MYDAIDGDDNFCTDDNFDGEDDALMDMVVTMLEMMKLIWGDVVIDDNIDKEWCCYWW